MEAGGEIAKRFQSTLPTRGSDADAIVPCAAMPNFNPRSPRGGATNYVICGAGIMYISIHAPHEGERPDGGEPQIIAA